MDLNRLNQNHNEARHRYEEMRRETQAHNADRVRGARQELARLSEMRADRIRRGRARAHEAHMAETKHGSSDQIEISDRARIMASQHEKLNASHEQESTRANHVADLKARHQRGALNTPVAIDRAAQSLLRGAEQG